MTYTKPEIDIHRFETIRAMDQDLVSYTNAAIAGNEVAQFKSLSAARTVRVQTIIQFNRGDS